MSMSNKKYMEKTDFFFPLLACTHYVANKSSFKVQLHWKIIFSAFMHQYKYRIKYNINFWQLHSIPK